MRGLRHKRTRLFTWSMYTSVWRMLAGVFLSASALYNSMHFSHNLFGSTQSWLHVRNLCIGSRSLTFHLQFASYSHGGKILWKWQSLVKLWSVAKDLEVSRPVGRPVF
jgi:hypothetical protein